MHLAENQREMEERSGRVGGGEEKSGVECMQGLGVALRYMPVVSWQNTRFRASIVVFVD